MKTRYSYKCIDGRSSWDAHFNILSHVEALGEIFFWKDNLENLNKRYIHSYFDPQEYVYSDASSTGLGAVYGKRKSPKSDKPSFSQKNRVYLQKNRVYLRKTWFFSRKTGFFRKTKFFCFSAKMSLLRENRVFL